MVNRDTLEKVHERMNDEIVDTTQTDDVISLRDSAQAPGINLDLPSSGNWCCIAQDQSHNIHLPLFLSKPQNASDPAYKVSLSCEVRTYTDTKNYPHQNFYNNLLSHLLARHLRQVTVSDEPEYSTTELANVKIQGDSIFSHATAILNFKAYDMTQDYDSINVNGSRCNIMLRACDDARHPFWYARVLGIYHANVFFGPNFDTQPERMEFFFVRWFGRDPDWQGGPGTRRLDRIGWVPESDPSGAFGFLDPARVIRACHLIPAFVYGKTTGLLSASLARESSAGDWVNYYVSRYVPTIITSIYWLTYIPRFVDRDMMMRYLGWGIGHRNPPDFSHEANALIASSHDRELEQYDDVETPQIDPIVAQDKAQDSEDEMDGGDRSSGAELDLGGSDSDRESDHNEVVTMYNY